VTAFTVVNLKEVEDSARQSGMSPSLEARFARRHLGSDSVGVSYQRLAPGFRVPFGHRHADQEELYLVLTGSARMKLDDEVVELRPWDVVRVASDTMRNLEAGPEGAEVVVFGAGTMGDTDMTPGWWTD
jgi:uncharacterized cupin superfamily protein